MLYVSSYCFLLFVNTNIISTKKKHLYSRRCELLRMGGIYQNNTEREREVMLIAMKRRMVEKEISCILKNSILIK